MSRRCTVTLCLITAWLLLSSPLAVSAQTDGDESSDPSAPSEGSEDAAAQEQADSQSDEDTSPHMELDIDARLELLDRYLAEVQTPTRRYFYSWVTTQVALTAAQAYVATSWDRRVVSGSYYIGTALSATSLALMLLQPKPGLNGSRRYRAMSQDSEEDKQAKLQAGEAILAGQAKADLRATSVTQHLTGLVAALGSGLGVLLGWDNSLKEAVTRTVGVFFIAELQIVTRPRDAIQRMNSYSNMEPTTTVALLPMLERGAQGLTLAGTF